jgi:acyl-coenzyme A thioesterase PaaI-like protein
LTRARLIRARVLRGIALNRTPGLHFPANFLDIAFERVTPREARLHLEPGPWCADAAGEADFGAFAILADLALGAVIRANLARHARLGTVAMSLQFGGAPRLGRLRAEGAFRGFFRGSAGRLGTASVEVRGERGLVCFGTGTFMALEPPAHLKMHPVPHRARRAPEPPRLREADLDAAERAILRRADAALHGRRDFVSAFWGIHARRTRGGAQGSLHNGLHVGNRVGHAQGGILIAFAAQAAAAALGKGWSLSGVCAAYVRPGQGPLLRARSRIVHHGGLTAVVRTDIDGEGGRRVLEVLTTHNAMGGK